MALVIAGLLVIGYGVGFAGRPDITCRGVPMGPGDVCHKSSFTARSTDTVQTYEQRLAAARASQPIIIGMGVLVAAFGSALLVPQMRRSRGGPDADPQSADRSIGP